MKTLAIYALEVLACSGVLLAAYTILLDRRVKFRWCRLYLLASTAAAALIPLLRIPVWPGQVIVATPTVTAPDLADWTAEVLPDAEAHAITPGHLCLGDAEYLLARNALNELRNQRIASGGYTDAADAALANLLRAKVPFRLFGHTL